MTSGPRPPVGEPAAPTTVLPRELLPQTASIDAGGGLSVGGMDLVDLAETHGTPLFVYDEDHIRARCREACAAFGTGVSYGSKAFLCRAMARLVHDEGLDLDVATGGELHLALAAAVPGDRLVLHGNNKSIPELRQARQLGTRIVVDSFDEIDRIESLHAADGLVARTLVRITPGVQPDTHAHVRTGQVDSKFGFSLSDGDAAKALSRVFRSTAFDLLGSHVHIGSQIFVVEPFERTIAMLADLIEPLGLSELCVGGGLAVAYVQGEVAPTMADWAAAIHGAARTAGITARITVEPGRWIVAAAGLTLYRVGTIKTIAGVRTYVSVDGGMSDNPRPVLYGTGYEAFLPRATDAERPRAVTVVGKHCESGDVLVRNARLPADLAVGDILCTPVTGAYGYSMASNYNRVPRPAVVFVRNGEARLVLRRETFEDLIDLDVG